MTKRIVFDLEAGPDEDCDATFTLEGWEEEVEGGSIGVTLYCNGRYLTSHRAANWDRMFGKED